MKMKTLYRSLHVESDHINEEERTVELTFSSETEEVIRHFGSERGIEVLDHSNSNNVDLSRLNDGAPVIDSHTGDQLGVVENASIDTVSKKGRAKLRFSKATERAKEVFADIVDNIRRNISAGYKPIKFVREARGPGQLPIYRAVQWMPLEISIVPVPADSTVGVGREQEQEYEVDIEDKEQRPFEGEHACRLEDPAQFDRFRRNNNHEAVQINGKRGDAIFGIFKEGGSKLQSARFKIDEFTESEARKWCKDHNGKFEASEKRYTWVLKHCPRDSRGNHLASVLNTTIDNMVTNEMSKDQILQDIASAASISESTINQILDGSISCPAIAILQGFADVLNMSIDTLIAIAEQDGCQYERVYVQNNLDNSKENSNFEPSEKMKAQLSKLREARTTL